MAAPSGKVVIVGNTGIGKTCLLISFTKSQFPSSSVPAALDEFRHTHTVDGTAVELLMADTNGDTDQDRLRPLSYVDAKVVLLAFSVADAASLSEAKSRWAPEVAYHCAKTPLFLVGLKTDLKDDAEVRKRAAALATELGAAKYFECSSKEQRGLKEIFDEAARCVLKAPASAPQQPFAPPIAKGKGRRGGGGCVIL